VESCPEAWYRARVINTSGGSIKSFRFIPSSEVEIEWELGWGIAHIAEEGRGWDVEGKRCAIWSAMVRMCFDFCVPTIVTAGVERYKYWEVVFPVLIPLHQKCCGKLLRR
jgi:hypothetical protein